MGWLDYGLPLWIYPVGATCCWALVRAGRGGAGPRGPHPPALARAGGLWRLRLGLAAQIAYAGYDYHNKTGYVFEQPRYLYPLIALYATRARDRVTALGRRAAPTLAATFIGITCLQLPAAVFATMARYYG